VTGIFWGRNLRTILGS